MPGGGPGAGGRAGMAIDFSDSVGVSLGATEQVLSVTDIISEGPIGGLVLGGKSVFLNDDPIFDDNEVGFASTAGMRIAGLANSTEVIINSSDVEVTFEYNPAEENETGTRFLLIHNLYAFEHSATTSYVYSSSSAASAVGEATGFKLRIDGDFSSLPSSLVASYGAISVGNFSDGHGLAFIYNKTQDRFVEGTVSAVSNTQLEVTLNIKNLEDNPWIQTTDLKISISELKKITKVEKTDNEYGGKITLASPPSKDFVGLTFSISEPVYSNQNNPRSARNRKYESSGFQFRPGTIDQQPLDTLTGGVGSSSVSLPISSVAELHTGVPSSIVFTASEAAEVDSVHLVFRYSSGLYSLNTDDGKKGHAGAGYVIRLETQSENGTFIDQGFLTGNQEMSSNLRKQLLGLANFGSSVAVDSTLGGAGTLVTTGANQGLNVAMLSDGTTVDVLAEGTPYFQHGGKYLSGVTFTHAIDLTPFQPYSGFKLTICRITNSESSTDDNKGRAHSTPGLTFIHKESKKHQGIQSGGISNALGVIRDRVHFPYTAVANVTFNTRQFTSMPNRNYEVYGLKVKIPKNYTTREEFGLIDTSHTLTGKEIVGSNPEGSRLYKGLFTGAFREEKTYTDNPAWVFYDMITNNRYGAGEYVKEFDIDKFALYKIARYCDELVADGKGGVEPRFRANIYITKATDVYKVLKDMATIFRGMLYWMDGKLLTVIDEKKSPVYTFNRSNVIDGAFEYEYTGSKTRVNQMVVTWNNPKNEFKQEPLFIEDRQNIVKTGRIVKGKAVAFGCTSEGQAIRYGRWKLFTAINQTEVCAFETAINAAFLAPGDVINIQDNHDAGFDFGGRLSNASRNSGTGVTTLTLDRDLAASSSGTTEAVIGASGTYKIALLLVEEAFVAQELIQITAQPDVTPGNAITEWRLNFDSTTPRVKIVEDETARNALSGNVTGDYAYQLSNSKLYIYGSSSYAEVTDGTTIGQLVAAAVDKNNKPVHITHTQSTRTKEIDCLEGNSSGSSISLGKVLTTNDLSETEVTSALSGKIWALKDDNADPSLGSYKQYKILSITKDRDNSYSITAAEHFNSKFDSIETNFTTAVDDPLFPQETARSPLLAPLGLRATRFPNASKPDETILLEWNPPTDAENIVSYEVSSDSPDVLSSAVVSATSYEILDVPTGTHIFKVRSIDDGGRTSAPAIIEVQIEDTFAGSNNRVFGVLKGGKVSASPIINNDRVSTPVNQTVKFDKSPVFFFSPKDTTNTSKELVVGSGLSYSILKDHDTASWFTDANFTFSSGYIVLKDYASSGRELRLINRIEDQALGGVDYWFDQTKQTQKVYNQNETSNLFTGSPDIWTQVPNGRVKIENNSTKVVGTGTTFLTDLSITNVLKFSDSFAAKITSIESDTVLFIDKAPSYKTHNITSVVIDGANIKYTSVGHTFVVGDDISVSDLAPSAFNTPTTNGHAKEKVVAITTDSNGVPQTFSIKNNTSASGVASDSVGSATTAIGSSSVNSLFYKDELSLDFSLDFLLGKIDGAGAFQSYLELDTQIGSLRGLLVDGTVAAVNYSSTETQSTTFPSAGLFINATPVGFVNPEFRVQGAGFSQTASSFTADANDAFTAPSSGILNRQIHDNSAIAYSSGSALEFTVRVREKEDPTNTAKIVDKTFTITKVKDGAEGSEGRTVSLVSEDNTILYDAQGENPEYTGSSDNTLTFTATPFNFPANPLFRFTQDGTAGNWGDSSTLALALNTSTAKITDSFPKLITVEVAVRPDNWNTGTQSPTPVVAAKDTTPIIRVKKDAALAPIVSLTNPTQAIPADSSGTISSTALSTTGTSMEVIIGGSRGTYVGGTGVSSGGFSGTLQPGQWYIQAVSTTGPAAGNITDANSDNIIDIAAATASSINDSEIITWTVRANNAGTQVDIPISQTIFKTKAGADGNTGADGSAGADGAAGAGVTATNTFFAFDSNASGVVSNNNFSSNVTVIRGSTTLTFAASGTAANTFGIAISNATNCSPSVASDGTITATGTILTASQDNASFKATIQDRANSNATLGVIEYSLSKIKQNVRDGGTFIKQNATEFQNWANAVQCSTSAALEAFDFVIANSVDGFISKNDRITLVNQSANPPVSATRIYTSSTRRNSSLRNQISGSDFSTVVVSHISGSAIVDGTLSANKLAANTVLSNSLIAQNSIQLSPGGTGGKLFGGNKESGFNDTDAGFHLDGAGNVHIGNATNFFKFNASTGNFDLQGNVTIQGAKGDDGPAGDSVSSGTVDSFGNLLLTVQNASGQTVNTINVGSVKGDKGDDGDDGDAGPVSSAFYTITRSGNTAAPSDSEVNAATGRTTGPVQGDTCIVVNTATNPDTSAAYKRTASSWTSATLFITGDVIVDGSISSDELAANSVVAGKIAANAVTAGTVAANVIDAQQLAISNNSSSGSGIFMNSTDNRIEIRSGSAIRVAIGDLTGL